jgi:hypothetical protein
MVLFAGCDTGVQHMGPTEYGVKFRKLPRFLGGGVGGTGAVASPLETVVVMPWEDVILIDTSPKYLSWGKDLSNNGDLSHYVENEDVHTRARDGNEAALKVTVRYRIKPEPESLVKLVQEAATTEKDIRQLVFSVVRSDIRLSMNRLRTPEFRDDKKRNDTVDAAVQASREKLGPLGIEIEAIDLKQYRFVRLLPDGKEDTSYQDRLKDIQELEQDIEGERSRVETIRAKKHTELQQAESLYNQRIAEAQGFKEQSMFEGDGYFAARSNEAKAILAEGTAEVEGLRQQIAALSGSGGQALLRLEVAKQLGRANPKFFSLNAEKSGTTSLDLSKMDMNQLIQQLGVADAVQSAPPEGARDPKPSEPSAGTQPDIKQGEMKDGR